MRCTFSHGTAADHEKRIQAIRTAAVAEGRTIGILADLQGPKIRVAKFKEGSVIVENGQAFIIDSALAKDVGDNKQVGTDYEDLHKDLKAGDTLLLDDGNLVFTVKAVKG